MLCLSHNQKLRLYWVLSTSVNQPISIGNFLLRNIMLVRHSLSGKLHFQVMPTSGNQSTSMWDVPSIDELQEWLGSVCGGECASEIYEVRLMIFITILPPITNCLVLMM